MQTLVIMQTLTGIADRKGLDRPGSRASGMFSRRGG
jgi:hypothetical protein